MAAHEPTPWELDRRFDRLESTIESGFRRIDERLNQMVTADIFTLSQRANDERIADLKRELDELERNRKDDRRFVIKLAVPTITSVCVALISAIAAAATSGAGPF